MALDFVAGCLGGCAGVIVGHPFDTIKVHLQTQDFRNPKYRGTLHCLQTILRKESVGGLYRGISSPLAGVSLVNAVVFGVYGNLQRSFPDPDAPSSVFLAGAAAGLAQSFICSPMELAKTRLQLGAPYKGPLQCLSQVAKTEGSRGVFRGLGITVCREVPGVGSYFLAYELMTRNSNGPMSTPAVLMAGGLAGMLSWFITYPVDVLKSRVQTDGMMGTPRYKGVLDCYRQSVRDEGYGFLTRGLSSTLLRAFPTNAATFLVVTWVFRLAGVDSDQQQPPSIQQEPELLGAPILQGYIEKQQAFLKRVRQWSKRYLTPGFLHSHTSSLRLLAASEDLFGSEIEPLASEFTPEYFVDDFSLHHTAQSSSADRFIEALGGER